MLGDMPQATSFAEGRIVGRTGTTAKRLAYLEPISCLGDQWFNIAASPALLSSACRSANSSSSPSCEYLLACQNNQHVTDCSPHVPAVACLSEALGQDHDSRMSQSTVLRYEACDEKYR